MEFLVVDSHSFEIESLTIKLIQNEIKTQAKKKFKSLQHLLVPVTKIKDSEIQLSGFCGKQTKSLKPIKAFSAKLRLRFAFPCRLY